MHRKMSYLYNRLASKRRSSHCPHRPTHSTFDTSIQWIQIQETKLQWAFSVNNGRGCMP